jgi:hypothetical protein
VALGARALLPLRALLAAALLSLALGAALYASLNGRRSATPVAVRSHGLSQQGLLSLPPAARGPVSAALGADSPAYGVSATAAGFTASSPAQHLSSSFTSSGVSVATGATRLGLSLRGVGYGSALTALGSVAPRADGNRVFYAHPGVSEWYANGPLGLEQGFTIARQPAGRVAGALTLAIALSGNARASLAGNAQSITWTHAGKTVLRYTGLSARDARGRVLRSWLALERGRLLLRVDTAGARYPLRIDPFVQQGAKLTGSGESGKGALGFSVALSANGDTALIGAPEDDGGVGAAWVFTRTGSTWTQQGEKLTGAGEEERGEFGYSVALSANGDTALIGAEKNHNFVGAAWVFTRTGSTWTQQGEKLTGSAEESSPSGVYFGRSVALSADGDTALIGGPQNEGEVGAAWVFTRSGEKWAQQGSKLTGAGQFSEGNFGESVALSGEGDTAIIGAPVESIPPDYDEVGSVYVFTRSGTKWTQQGAKFTGTGELGENSYFGTSLALSANGDTALVGGEDDNTNVGAAWVFTRSGETWSQQGPKLTGSGESGEGYFGHSVALSAEGNIALIGGGSDDGKLGAAWAFTRSGETWSQQGSKLTGGGESGEGRFGHGVALSAEGSTALVGGPYDSAELGAAWAFVSGPTVTAGSASEVTPKVATLSATVNPDEENVTACEFEYGTTIAYGKTMPCSSLPGSGGTPVTVSASLSGLTADTTYHFRVSATNAAGTNTGEDATFTTLLTSVSATAKEEKPAEAKDGELTSTASGGKGTITVGPYGSDPGGSLLAKGTSDYVDTYHAAGSTFSKVEFKDCELGGGKSIWWDNPAGTWEPILGPTAVYSEGSPPCITVTITESTKPDLAQLTGTRFGTRFGDAPAALEYGKCEAAKDGEYGEGQCQTEDLKKGLPKGKFEWYANPGECFPEKDGDYKEGGCLTRDEKKGKPKGKFEKASGTFTGAGGVARFEITTLGTLECKTSESVGEMTGQKTGRETVTYRGCKLGSSECASTGETTNAIQTSPLEIFIEEEEGKEKDVYTEFYEDPIPVMTFRCGDEEYTLKGGARGETKGDRNVMSSTSESVFKAGVGEQDLDVVADGKEYKTTMVASYVLTGTQATEIDTNPPPQK